MEPVLRLLEDFVSVSLKNLGGDLLPPVGGQTVLHHTARVGQLHKLTIHTVAGKRLLSLGLFLLLAHGGPHVCNHHVRVFDSFSREYKITLKHELRHTVTLGTDIFGNIQRLDNALNSFQEKLTACEAQLENTKVQLENAKLEVQKPFPQEDELKTKTARLNELNAMLNLDKRENEIVDGERAEEEPSRSSDDRER